MRETSTVFEQRWTFWLSTLSGAALIVSAGLATWLQSGANGFSALPETTKESLLSQYNGIAHGGFIAILAVLSGQIIRSITKADNQKAAAKTNKTWPSRIIGFIKQH